MWEFHDSNGNGLGDMWWTEKFIYFSILDKIIDFMYCRNTATRTGQDRRLSNYASCARFRLSLCKYAESIQINFVYWSPCDNWFFSGVDLVFNHKSISTAI